jgi:hypothetical protein
MFTGVEHIGVKPDFKYNSAIPLVFSYYFSFNNRYYITGPLSDPSVSRTLTRKIT